MYSNLRVLMLKKHITIESLSKALKINRNTLSKKINGNAKFTLDEITQIRDMFFPDVTLDTLCVKEEC